MLRFLLFLCMYMEQPIVAMLAAFRSATRPRVINHPITRNFVRSMYSSELLSEPGHRLVDLQLLSGNRILAHVEENLTVKDFKQIAMEKFNYRDVFFPDQIVIVRNTRLNNSVIKIPRDDAKIGEIVPLGKVFYASIVSPVYPLAKRDAFLFMGIESGQMKYLRLRPPTPSPPEPLYDVFQHYIQPGRNRTKTAVKR